jgi:hypothetical protein
MQKIITCANSILKLAKHCKKALHESRTYKILRKRPNFLNSSSMRLRENLETKVNSLQKHTPSMKIARDTRKKLRKNCSVDLMKSCGQRTKMLKEHAKITLYL